MVESPHGTPVPNGEMPGMLLSCQAGHFTMPWYHSGARRPARISPYGHLNKEPNLTAFGIPYSKNITVELFDAGRRAADAINEHITRFGWWDIRSKWVAIRLADGTSDGVLYDTKQDAVRHQHDEFLCAYLNLRGVNGGARDTECAIMIKFHRDMYKAGFRMPDRDARFGGPDAVMSTQRHDWYRSIILPAREAMGL